MFEKYPPFFIVKKLFVLYDSKICFSQDPNNAWVGQNNFCLVYRSQNIQPSTFGLDQNFWNWHTTIWDL
jgi:hypothetical protein